MFTGVWGSRSPTLGMVDGSWYHTDASMKMCSCMLVIPISDGSTSPVTVRMNDITSPFLAAHPHRRARSMPNLRTCQSVAEQPSYTPRYRETCQDAGRVEELVQHQIFVGSM